MLKYPNLSQQCGSSFVRCGLCGVSGKPFRILSKGSEIDEGSRGITEDLREKVTFTLLLILVVELFDNFMHLKHSN